MHSETILAAQELMKIIFLVLLAGVIAGKIAQLIKLPDVVIFLFIGILSGPTVLGILNVQANSVLNQFVLLFGSSFILFHGGTVTQFEVLKKVWLTLTLLSTLGVLITASIVGIASFYFLGLPILVAFLLGAVLASTDPAALVPIFQQIPIRPKVAQTVISESAFTDATGAILALVLTGMVTTGTEASVFSSILEFMKLAVGGLLVGAVVGWLFSFLLSEKDHGLLKEFSAVVTVIMVIGAYLGAELLHTSGFMAVFTAGLILGNAKEIKINFSEKIEHELHLFLDTVSLKMRMFIFILLGSQVNFQAINEYLIGGLLVVLVFIFLARPFTVLASTLPDKRADWKTNEILFMFWTRETGVIPAALAGILLGAGVEKAEVIASITFIAILATLLIQATTTKLLAAKLDLLEK